MRGIELTLNLDEIQVDDDGRTLADQIIAMAAHQLLGSIGGYDDPTRTNFRRRVADITDDEIRARVVPVIEEVMRAPVQRTNSYGEPTGEPVTMRSEIERIAREVLTRPDRDSFTGKGRTLIQKLIEAEVTRVLEKELRAEIAAAKEQVIAAVRGSAADLIAEAVKRGLA